MSHFSKLGVPDKREFNYEEDDADECKKVGTLSSAAYIRGGEGEQEVVDCILNRVEQVVHVFMFKINASHFYCSSAFTCCGRRRRVAVTVSNQMAKSQSNNYENRYVIRYRSRGSLGALWSA